MYTGLATVVVVFFLYCGHCECLASLVGPVRVLSAVMFFWNCFMNKWSDDDDDDDGILDHSKSQHAVTLAAELTCKYGTPGCNWAHWCQQDFHASAFLHHHQLRLLILLLLLLIFVLPLSHRNLHQLVLRGNKRDDSKLQHSVQNYFNSRSNIFRKLTHGHKIRVLRNFNSPHLSVTDMAPSHCSCSSAATPVALPRAYASSVGSGIVVIRRRPAAVRTLRLPFRRQRTLNRPYAMQTYSFYRAACNADAVLWWDFCPSVCPSHAWIVTKL